MVCLNTDGGPCRFVQQDKGQRRPGEVFRFSHSKSLACWHLRSEDEVQVRHGVFSRKHREGFFRWVHLSCSHESHYKVSWQGIIIMKVNARSHCKESLHGVIARSHCKESLQGVIARSHCKESLQGVIARSHESHCELRRESSASCKCKESSASCKCKESGASCKCMESSASCKCTKSSASCKCKESSAIDLRGVKISS